MLLGWLLCPVLYGCDRKVDPTTQRTDRKHVMEEQMDTSESPQHGRQATRMLSDLPLVRGTTRDEFVRKAGPPDTIRGSGVEWYVYRLPDGRSVQIFFAGSSSSPPTLTAAYMVEHDGTRHDVFQGK